MFFDALNLGLSNPGSSPRQCRGFNNVFSRRATDFLHGGKTFGTELCYKKNLPLDGQNRHARSS